MNKDCKLSECYNCGDIFQDPNNLKYCNKLECRSVLQGHINMARTLAPCPMNSDRYINELLKHQDKEQVYDI